MGILSQFHGELNGSTDAKQLPNKAFNYAYIKAMPANTGNVYVGGATVTRAGGSSDSVTTGFVLDAGDVLPIDGEGNMNMFYIICDSAADDITYWGLTLY